MKEQEVADDKNNILVYEDITPNTDINNHITSKDNENDKQVDEIQLKDKEERDP